MKTPKKEPWRLLVGGIAGAYILFLWAKKDIFSIYSTMPKEQVLPLIGITLAVSALKAAVIAAIAFLVKWIKEK